jgi:hypothetical protein
MNIVENLRITSYDEFNHQTNITDDDNIGNFASIAISLILSFVFTASTCFDI